MQQITWLKSSYSFSNSNCVEVAHLPGGGIGVRDSKSPAGPVLRFTPQQWDVFTAGLSSGDFDTLARP